MLLFSGKLKDGRKIDLHGPDINGYFVVGTKQYKYPTAPWKAKCFKNLKEAIQFYKNKIDGII